MATGIPEIQGETSPSYKRILVTGLFGSIQPFGLQAMVYSTQQIIDKVIASEPLSPNRTVIKRTVECELIIDLLYVLLYFLLLQVMGFSQKDVHTPQFFVPTIDELISFA